MNNDKNEPVHLIEDEETGDRFLVYGSDRGLRLDIRYQGETLWMTQAQIAQLFGRDVSTISRHIANIFEDGELAESSSLQKTQTTSGRPTTLYNLDVVISVGYRVSSTQATMFRRWATGILVQFAKMGFVVDSARLKQPDEADRIAELRDIIRDIRSDEANVYRELRRICSMCQDYDGSKKPRAFSTDRHRPRSSMRSRRKRRRKSSQPERITPRHIWVCRLGGRTACGKPTSPCRRTTSARRKSGS